MVDVKCVSGDRIEIPIGRYAFARDANKATIGQDITALASELVAVCGQKVMSSAVFKLVLNMGFQLYANNFREWQGVAEDPVMLASLAVIAKEEFGNPGYGADNKTLLWGQKFHAIEDDLGSPEAACDSDWDDDDDVAMAPVSVAAPGSC